jgi:hypothetical protein
MRNPKNHVVLGVALGALLVAGTLWAGEAKSSLPLIKAGKKAQQVRLSKAAATNVSAVSQAIIDEIDVYWAPVEETYHSKITDPSVPWHEKCRLAIAHGRLSLLHTEAGGSLGGPARSARRFSGSTCCARRRSPFWTFRRISKSTRHPTPRSSWT